MNNDLNNNGLNQEVNTEVNNQTDNVVTPIVERRDLADKTIDAVENFVDTKDHKDEYENDELKKYKTSAILSYVPFVSLFYIIRGDYKKSNYLKFHVNHGLNITILFLATVIIEAIVSALFSINSLVINSTPTIISIIFYVMYFICFLLTLFGIMNTSNDLSKELPVIGKIRLLK